MKHLLIIDGHHLMYRAYYAIPPTFRTAAGEQTNAVYGVTSMILAMLKTEEPDAMVFCFDAGEETFRHQEHAEYKEGRAETPDDFYLQIPRILQVIEAFQFSHVSDRKYEADDFLCTYATAGKNAGMRVTIVTGDKDALQLANEQVRIAIPHKGYQQPEYLGPEEILAKYGVRPDQVPSYKGLRGDPSDNLPGVHGIGPKIAADLLQKFDTLEGIYAHLEEVKPAVREKLAKDKEQAFFCEHMARLVCADAPLPLESLTLQPRDATPLISLLRELEFTSLVRRLESLAQTPYGSKIFQIVSAPVAVKTKASEEQLSLF